MSDFETLGKDPITGDKPAGESVQYDDDFEQMRAEVQKLDSVTGETVDWGLVENTGVEILKNRSKHLLVAIYLTMAFYQRRNYEGLTTGLTVLRDLVNTFWDNMEPPLKRKRGRIEGFVWLNERLGKSMPDNKPSSGELDTLHQCQTVIGELSAALKEKLTDEAPGLADIKREISSHIKALEASMKAAEARRERAEKVATGELDEQSTPDDARKIYQQLRGKIKMVCDILRRANPADPTAYRLLRSSTWGPLVVAPPGTNGATQVPPPPAEVVSKLSELKAKSDWASLIEAAESAFDDAPMWLDVHLFLLKAFEELGDQYESAALAVRLELLSLVQRLPDLMALEFNDGMLFASGDTQKWLDKELRSSGTGRSGGGDTADAGPEGLEEALQEARRLAGKGKLSEAVQRMQVGIAAAGKVRHRFFWRLELARLCLDAGRVVLAAPLLEELEALIERHNLEEWEPELCKSVYTSLLATRRLLLKDTRKATPELVQKTNLLQDRLSRLDPTALLSME